MTTSARKPHLNDYLAIVRSRRGVFLLVATTVFTAIVAWSLLQAPAYRATATLLVESGAGGDLFRELQGLSDGPAAKTEIQLMRSRAVARRAFARLRAGDFLVEENVFRPLDALWRSVTGGNLGRDVTIATKRLEPGAPTLTFRFVFDGKRAGATASVSVEKRRKTRFPWQDDVAGTVSAPLRAGKPIPAFGREFEIGDPADYVGRTFRLTLRSPENGALWIQERIRATEIGRATGVVQLQLEAVTPHLAQRVTAAVAQAYLELKAEHRKTHAKAALEFVTEEAERASRRLRESEVRLDEFKSQANAVLLSERATWLVERGSAVALERAEVRLRMEEFERLRAQLATDAGVVAVLATVGGERTDPLTRALAQQLARLEFERDVRVQKGVRPNHPARGRIDAEIETIRQRLRSALEAGLVQAMRKAVGRREYLDAKVAEYERETTGLPATERELTQRARAVEANLRIYGFLVQKGQEAQIAHASAVAPARLIDTPLLPRERSRPHLTLRFAIASLLALLSGLMGALFAEYVDRTIRTPAALEDATRRSLFASVPAFRTVRGRAARTVKGPLVTLEQPHGILAEPYRVLRTNLRFARLERPIKTVAVTSSVPGEGKSVTNSNLAVACAQMGDRVVLVDADLRRSTTHVLFGHGREPGLAEIVLDGRSWRDVARPGPVDGLSLIHAGQPVRNPAPLFATQVFSDLLDDIAREFDWVIFDVPPVLAVADAFALLSRLDAVLLLTAYRRCTADTVRSALRQLRRLDVDPLGVVLNRYDARRGGQEAYGAYAEYGDAPDNGHASQPQKARS